MSPVPIVIGVFVLIFAILHSIIFRTGFKEAVLLYLGLGVIVIILVITGVISESHFQDGPHLIDGIKSLFGA